MADDRTYIKLHDGMPGHPKVRGLSDKAFRTYIRALCYCSEYLTDGVVIAPVARDLGVKKVWDELVASGLVESATGGYLMHDYLQHQRSAEQVRQYKEAKREAGRKGGKARANNQAKAKQVLEQTDKQNPSEINPETETDTEEKTSSSLARKRATQAPSSIDITDAMRAWAVDKATGVDLESETSRFLDHHRAKGSTFKDWTAAWRTWMSRAAEYGNVRSLPSRSGARKQQVLVGEDRWRDVTGDEVTIGRKTRWVPA